MEKRVLLTGASGLIGRAVLPALQREGFDVVVLSRKPGSVTGVDAIKTDLLDQSSMEAAVLKAKASHLLHLAWHDDPVDRWSSPQNLDWAAATIRLVRSFSKAGGERAVCVGSCAEYEWATEVLSEQTALKPASLYGAAKSATGMALSAAAPSLELSFAWARVFFCFGPGEPEGRLLGDLIKGLSAGNTVDCTDGEQARDFMHTDDVAQALVEVLKSNVSGPINIASGHPTQVKSLILRVANRLNATDRVKLGAKSRPDTDPDMLIADATKLLNEVGFKPRYDASTGVDAVLRSEGLLKA